MTTTKHCQNRSQGQAKCQDHQQEMEQWKKEEDKEGKAKTILASKGTRQEEQNGGGNGSRNETWK